jgi:hypothetical protein
MKRLILALCISCLLIDRANAELLVTEYVKMKSNPEVMTKFKDHLTGIAAGISLMNVRDISEGQSPAFCQPETLSLNQGNYVDILDNVIKNYPKMPPDFPVSAALLMGLIETFPCPGNK